MHFTISMERILTKFSKMFMENVHGSIACESQGNHSSLLTQVFTVLSPFHSNILRALSQVSQALSNKVAVPSRRSSQTCPILITLITRVIRGLAIF